MSDPFDDDDDGVWNNPETLGFLEAAEEQAIQASQKPAAASTIATKPRFTQPIRHVLAKPAKRSPTSSATSSNNANINRQYQKKTEPRPVNTEPGIRGTGFGWEIGGKRSFDIERHIDNVQKREAYWNAGGDGDNGGQQQVEDDDEESNPIDVVMDGSGNYALANTNTNTAKVISRNFSNGSNISNDEAIITDRRREQPSMLGESLGLAGSSHLPSNSQQQVNNNNNRFNNARKQSEDAIAARRRAIAAATLANNSDNNVSSEPFIQRQPMSRSNSASSTNVSTTNTNLNHQSRPFSTNNHQYHQQQNNNNSNNQQFTNRSLARSQSAGAQIFNRSNISTNAYAGPSRLPTIPSGSQSNDSQYGSSQNGNTEGREHSAPPPMSQGSLARAAAIELDNERRKRQELEAELANLKAQAVNRPQPVARINMSQSIANGGDLEVRVRELQNQVWAAKGEAEMIRRAQKEEHQRHLAELEKLKLTIQDKDVQIKEKENQTKKQMENIKHQAVFSNHAAHNSAMKTRQQSQRFPASSQSQYRALPTPVKNGSPSRRRYGTNDDEPGPLVASVKGKGKAPPIAGPVFGGFNNAFAATPTVGPRTKRQKTADLSPQGSPTRGPSPSPFRASPARSQRKLSPILGEEEGEEDIDWGPAIGPPEEDMFVDDEVNDEDKRDERAELLYHLMNHVNLSAFQITLAFRTEPTIYRLINYRPPINMEGHEMYTQRCADLLKAFGNSELSFEELLEIIINSLSDMLEYSMRVIQETDSLSLLDTAVFCNILALLSSSILLCPTSINIISSTNLTENLKMSIQSIYSDHPTLTKYKERLNDQHPSSLEKDKARDKENWCLELASSIAELAEAICFVSQTSLWKGDELVDIILGLIASHQHPYIVKRGMELFYVASRQLCHFRSLITASDRYKLPGSPDESPLIDRLSRLLINPLPSANVSESLQMSTLAIRGLCMLSISHSDAVIIMGSKSALVPALIMVLQRESTKLYGIHGVLHSYKDALSILLPTLSLLHHLVFPSPISSSSSKNQFAAKSQSQSLSQSIPKENNDDENPPIGIDLPERIVSASMTREFNGLQHIFISALGCMSYSQVDDEVISEIDQGGIQYLSGDLLENVVEGPEGDAIYELYVPIDEEVAEQDVEEAGLEHDHDNAMEVDNAEDDEDDDDDGIIGIGGYQRKEKSRSRSGTGIGNISEPILIDDDDD